MQLRTSHAHEEGCDRQWSISTTKFTGHDGQVTKLHGNRVKFENGKFAAISNSDFEMDADLILLAMGFTGPVKNGLLDSLGVKYDARGAVSADENFMTNLDGVFVGGDTKRGASLIVWAIAEGRKMAAGIDQPKEPSRKLTDQSVVSIQSSVCQGSSLPCLPERPFRTHPSGSLLEFLRLRSYAGPVTANSPTVLAPRPV
jgi:pyruvate/2-oxoglutarate dehydrogenase complex dihydrolipoamide dehydrogenase (E3) component